MRRVRGGGGATPGGRSSGRGQGAQAGGACTVTLPNVTGTCGLEGGVGGESRGGGIRGTAASSPTAATTSQRRTRCPGQAHGRLTSRSRRLPGRAGGGGGSWCCPGHCGPAQGSLEAAWGLPHVSAPVPIAPPTVLLGPCQASCLPAYLHAQPDCGASGPVPAGPLPPPGWSRAGHCRRDLAKAVVEPEELVGSVVVEAMAHAKPVLCLPRLIGPALTHFTGEEPEAQGAHTC